MENAHERLSRLEIDEEIRLDATNVLTSISNYGVVYSWILKEDLKKRGAAISHKADFDLRIENALYILIQRGIIGRNKDGAYFIKIAD